MGKFSLLALHHSRWYSELQWEAHHESSNISPPLILGTGVPDPSVSLQGLHWGRGLLQTRMPVTASPSCNVSALILFVASIRDSNALAVVIEVLNKWVVAKTLIKLVSELSGWSTSHEDGEWLPHMKLRLPASINETDWIPFLHTFDMLTSQYKSKYLIFSRTWDWVKKEALVPFLKVGEHAVVCC